MKISFLAWSVLFSCYMGQTLQPLTLKLYVLDKTCQAPNKPSTLSENFWLKSVYCVGGMVASWLVCSAP